MIELVADEREVIQNVLLEPLDAVGIVVVRVVADDDVRPRYDVPQEPDLRESFHRDGVCGDQGRSREALEGTRREANDERTMPTRRNHAIR